MCVGLAAPCYVTPPKFQRHLNWALSFGRKRESKKKEILYSYLHLGEAFISALHSHHLDHKLDTPGHSQFSYYHIAFTGLYCFSAHL